MISGKTLLLGLLGQPVHHSISPAIHNAALKEMGLDLCYIALPSESKDLEQILKTLRLLNFQGLNVTIPHKENIVKLCSSLCPIAKKLKAVNTLKPDQKGGWIGTNTDVEGFIAPLKGLHWDKRKALVIGSGGSSRAVVAGLKILNFEEIIVVGRNKNSLINFREDFSTNSDDLLNINLKVLLDKDKDLQKEITQSSLIINATPVGMSTTSERMTSSSSVPLGQEIWKYLNPKTFLYDLIYNPRPTEWLKLGEKHGCKKIDGMEMLIQQGAASLRFWLNKEDIPIQTMKEAAIQALTI